MLYAPIDTASTGDNTIVAAVPGRKVRVVSYILASAGAVNVRWKSASTNLSGAMTLAAGVPIPVAASPEGVGGQYGVLETASGEALVLNLSGNVQVSGHLTFVVVN